MVLLHERHLDPVPPQRIVAENFGEKPARIAVPDRPDLLHLRDCGRDDLHPALYDREPRD